MAIKNAANLLASTQIAGGSIVEGVEALWEWNGTDITQFGDGAGNGDSVYGSPDGTLSVGPIPGSGIDVPSGNALIYTNGTSTSAVEYYKINDLPALPERFIFRARLGPETSNCKPIMCLGQDVTHHAAFCWAVGQTTYQLANNNSGVWEAGLYLRTGGLGTVQSGAVFEVDCMLRHPSTGVDPQICLDVRGPGVSATGYVKGGETWTLWGGSGAAYDASWQSGGILTPAISFTCGSSATAVWISEMQIFPHPMSFGRAQQVTQVRGAESNLWAVPATPHASNDEFDGSDMSDWSVQNLTDAASGSISLGTVDPYDTTFNSGNVVRANLGDRTSWVLLQAPAYNKGFIVWKALTLPTNLLVVARFKINHNRTSTNDDGVFGLTLGTLSGGVPVTASRVVMVGGAPSSGSVRPFTQLWNTGGSEVNTHVDALVDDAWPYAHSHVALHKVGADYHYYVGNEQGSWSWFDSVTSIGFTPDYVGMELRNTSVAAPGVTVVGVDYLRFYETANFFL